MFKWTQQSAVSELEVLIAEIPALESDQRMSAAHVRWLTRALRVLEQVFGSKSRYPRTLGNLSWRQTGSFLIGGPGDPEGGRHPQRAIERLDQQAYVRDLDFAKGLLLGARDEIIRAGLENV